MLSCKIIWARPCDTSIYTVNSEIFVRILFSRIGLEDVFVTLKFANMADIATSINNGIFSPFHEGLIFMKLRICEVS